MFDFDPLDSEYYGGSTKTHFCYSYHCIDREANVTVALS